MSDVTRERAAEALALVASLTAEQVLAMGLRDEAEAARVAMMDVHAAEVRSVLVALGLVSAEPPPPAPPPPTPEQEAEARAKRVLLWRSRREASACGGCGGAIAAGEPVALHYGYACCTPCHAKEQAGRYRPGEYADAPCLSCGRSVAREVVWYRKPGRAYCCLLCRHRDKSRRQAAKKAAAREAAAKLRCAVCGDEFESRRSDARTCGPACRQKLRRHRLRASRENYSSNDDRS